MYDLVWVSGSTGFVGSHMVTELISRGYQVQDIKLHRDYLILRDTGSNRIERLGYSQTTVKKAPRFVLHFASSGIGKPNDYSVQKLNYEISLKLTKALIRLNTPIDLYIAGSIDEYGINVVRNEAIKIDTSSLNAYAFYKNEIRDETSRICCETLVRPIHLRISNLFGNRQRKGTLLPLILDKNIRRLVVKKSRYWRDLHYVGDFTCNLGMLMQTRHFSNIYNMGSGMSQYMQAFISDAWERTGKKSSNLCFEDGVEYKPKYSSCHMDISLVKGILGAHTYRSRTYGECLYELNLID